MPNVTSHFDRLSLDYDQLAASSNWAPNHELAKALLALQIPDGQILDLGAGTGLTAEALLSSRHRGRLTCVEPSQNMAQIGRSRAKEAEWVVSNAEDFLKTQSAGTVSLITAIGLLEFVANPAKLIALSAHILRPDGILAVAFEERETCEPSATSLSSLSRRIGASPYSRPLTTNLVMRWAMAAGLSAAYVRRFDGYIRASVPVPYVLIALSFTNARHMSDQAS